MARSLKLTFLFLGALLLAAACLAQPHPVKSVFVLSVPPPEADPKPQTEKKTLLIGAFSAAAPFDNRVLVYRLGPERIETDFYNEFAAAPARLIADASAAYIDAASSRFRAVNTPGLLVADYALEAYVENICGNFGSTPPTAELSIRYSLYNMRPAQTKLVLEKRFSCQRLLSEESPRAVVSGLSECLKEILFELNEALDKAAQGR